jgi:hypothetical protein
VELDADLGGNSKVQDGDPAASNTPQNKKKRVTKNECKKREKEGTVQAKLTFKQPVTSCAVEEVQSQ